MKIPVRSVHWKNCWRVIPTRYPSEDLLKRVADPKDKPAVEQVDKLTSTRVCLELEDKPHGERVSGPGSQYIMASLSYSLLNKSRFNDGSYGVYYGANTLTTAVEETKYHRAEFLRVTAEGPMILPMRVVVVTLNGILHDIGGLKKKQAALYSPTSYVQSQAFARDLWEQQSNGIVYDSVRHPKGQCAAVFKPSILSHCRQERQLMYEWDGHQLSHIYEMQEFVKIK